MGDDKDKRRIRSDKTKKETRKHYEEQDEKQGTQDDKKTNGKKK